MAWDFSLINDLVGGVRKTTSRRNDLKKREKSREVFAGQKSPISLSKRPFSKNHESTVPPNRITFG
jgi:hypothetical protein